MTVQEERKEPQVESYCDKVKRTRKAGVSEVRRGWLGLLGGGPMGWVGGAWGEALYLLSHVVISCTEEIKNSQMVLSLRRFPNKQAAGAYLSLHGDT